MAKVDPFSPYQRISDRVLMIANQSSVQRSIYDKMSKRYRGVSPELSEKELLEQMQKAALDSIVQSAELLSAVNDELRRCSS